MRETQAHGTHGCSVTGRVLSWGFYPRVCGCVFVHRVCKRAQLFPLTLSTPSCNIKLHPHSLHAQLRAAVPGLFFKMSYTRVALQCHKISVAAAGPSPWPRCPAHGHPAARASVWGGSGEGGGVRTHGGHTHRQKYTATPQDLLITGENVHH